LTKRNGCFGYGSCLRSRENRSFAVDRRAVARLSDTSGHERRGFACTTPYGPQTETAFFAAPTLNRSLVAGSPPPAYLSLTESRSFSSTSWVTMCHRVDPETGPFGLTRLAAISLAFEKARQLAASLAQSQNERVRPLSAQWVKSASIRGSCLTGRSQYASTASRGARLRFLPSGGESNFITDRAEIGPQDNPGQPGKGRNELIGPAPHERHRNRFGGDEQSKRHIPPTATPDVAIRCIKATNAVWRQAAECCKHSGKAASRVIASAGEFPPMMLDRVT